MLKIKKFNEGFVGLVSHLGNDDSIITAARQSTSSLKQISDKEKFIGKLLKNGHMTPFEFVEFVFHIKIPIFIDRQLVRYRTAARVERSNRYNKPLSDCYLDFRISDELILDEWNEQARAFKLYKKKIEAGLKKEQARTCLPASLYTEYYWKINLRNLLHVFDERLAFTAQFEIREYVGSLWALAYQVVPITLRKQEELYG